MAADDRRVRRLAFGLLALLLASPAARADAPFALTVAPGGFDEHCIALAAGEVIRWRFRAAAAVEFNIHFHDGPAVHYPVRRAAAARGSGLLRARGTDDYCLMWTNKGTRPVRLEGAVERVP